MWGNSKGRVRAIVCSSLLVLSCVGCVGITLDKESEVMIDEMQESVYKRLQQRLAELDEKSLFYCRVKKEWPCDEDDYMPFVTDYYRFRVVKPAIDQPSQVALSKDMLNALRKCTLNDAVSLGIVRDKSIRTAGVAWFGAGGGSLAGVIVCTPENAYFIYTEMHRVADIKEEYEVYESFRSPPYYWWLNPYMAQCWGYPGICERNAIHAALMDKGVLRYLGAVDFMNACVTAFRLDMPPERILMVQVHMR